MKTSRPVAVSLLSLLLLFGSLQKILAATIVWGNISNDWATGTNWTGNAAPADSTTTDIASFGSGTAVNPNIATARSVGGLIFQSGSSSYTIGGSTLTIGSSGIANSATNTEALSNSVRISANQNWSTGTGGTLIFSNTVDLNANAATTRTLTVSGAGNTTFNGVVQNSFSGSTAAITFSGSGALTLAGANTFSGGLTASGGGTVKLAHAAALGSGTFTIQSSAATIDNTSGSALTLSANNAQAWNSNFTFTGTNSLNLGTGAVTMSANRTITASASTLTVGGTIDLNSTAATARTLTFNGAGDVVLNGGVSNSFSGSTGNLTYNGSGALTLAAANTYSGNTTLNSGTLNFNNAAAISTGTFILAGGTLNNTSGSAITNSGNNAQNWNGDLNFTGSNALNLGTGAVTLSASRQVTVGASTLMVGGAVGGSGFGLTKLGAGTLALTGSNTYTGGTTLTAGTLSFANGSLGSSGAITMNGGTLQWNGSNTQDISSRLTLVAAKTATFDTNGNSVTLATAIGGSTSASLVKSGTGTLSLTGNNTFSGGTTVSAGTLYAGHANALGSGSASIGTSGTLSVASGITIPNSIAVTGIISGSATSSQFTGTISGTGTLGGTLTIASGGSIAPGNSPGILNVSGSVTYASGSSYAWELNALSTSTPGTNFDQILVGTTGSLTLNSGALLVPSFTGTATSPAAADSFWTAARSWTVVDKTGSGTVTGTAFTVDNSGWNNGTFTTTITGNTVTLDWAPSAIPEPSTYAAIFGGLALVGAVWHRRRWNAKGTGASRS